MFFTACVCMNFFMLDDIEGQFHKWWPFRRKKWSTLVGITYRLSYGEYFKILLSYSWCLNIWVIVDFSFDWSSILWGHSAWVSIKAQVENLTRIYEIDYLLSIYIPSKLELSLCRSDSSSSKLSSTTDKILRIDNKTLSSDFFTGASVTLPLRSCQKLLDNVT